MQHIPYIPKYTSNQSFKNDFAQSFSLAFIIRKNALILYSFSEEKEVQNGLFYHFIYKILVVNWSNMLRRKIIFRCANTKQKKPLHSSPHASTYHIICKRIHFCLLYDRLKEVLSPHVYPYRLIPSSCLRDGLHEPVRPDI